MESPTKKEKIEMFQAIETKYLGPTNCRGARFKATAAGGNVTVSMDYSLSYSENHVAVANALREKMGWKFDLTGGQLANGNYAFVSTKTVGENSK